MVTWKLYDPAFVKVADVFLAALVPFALKLTLAGGVPVVCQKYVRFCSPPSSAPSTLSAVVVPGAGFGFALAGVATVGGRFTPVLAPFTSPLPVTVSRSQMT